METPATPDPTLLTLDDVPAFLLREQLVSPEVFVDDPMLDIQDRSRRNANFSIIPSRGRRLLIKQPQAVRGSVAQPISVEARILQLVEEDQRLERMRARTPRFYYFDDASKILVTELLHPATTLLKFHLNLGQAHFPAEAARAVAASLADAHGALAEAHRAGLMDFLPKSRPGAFAWDDAALPQWDEINNARKTLVKQIAADGVLSDRDEVLAMTQEDPVPCHNDPRWDNFLVLAGEEGSGELNLRLIDWEAATLGDVAYDVAFAIAEYYRFWTGTSTFADDPAAEPRRQLFRMQDTHEAARAFLDAYAQRRGLDGAARAALGSRVLRYLPYCLVNQAFEAAQRANSAPPGARRALSDATALRRGGPEKAREIFGLEVAA